MGERKGNYAFSVLFFSLVTLLAAIQQQSGVIRVDQSSHPWTTVCICTTRKLAVTVFWENSRNCFASKIYSQYYFRIDSLLTFCDESGEIAQASKRCVTRWRQMHLIIAVGCGHWVRSFRTLGGCSRWIIS